MSHLILIRHGTTNLNKKSNNESAERIRGWVDLPLDEQGKRQAIALGAEFANTPIQHVYTSDFSRARDVAYQIAKARRVPLIKTDKLRPWNLGVLHGKEVDKVLPVMNRLIEQRPDLTVPDGESFNAYRMRYLPFLASMIEEAKDYHHPVVAVTHSRNIQLARAWDKAGRPADYSYDGDRMADYKDEVPPGGSIELHP